MTVIQFPITKPLHVLLRERREQDAYVLSLFEKEIWLEFMRGCYDDMKADVA